MVQELCRNLQEFLTSHGIPDWLVVFIISLCPILNADSVCSQQSCCCR